MPTLLAALVFSMGAPSVTAKTALEAASARQELRAAVEELRQAPSHRGERRVTRAMARVDATIDTAYHARNLTTPRIRRHALALRREVLRTIAGPDGVMVLRDDVLRFRAGIHRALADAARVRGAMDTVVIHLRAAVAADDKSVEHLNALKQAYEAAGRQDRVAEVARRILWLTTPRP